MQLFKNTNFDFLGKKWIFITLSLVVTAAGVASLIAKGGPSYGIDFNSGAEVRVRFDQDPDPLVAKIRSELSKKVSGEISIQRITGTPELIITTEVKADQKELNNREATEAALLAVFGDQGGKLALNSSSPSQLADKLRDPLLQAGVPISEQQLQDLATSIESYRTSHGGIIRSFNELSKVPGVTPQVIDALNKECVPGHFTVLSSAVVGPKVGKELRHQAILATLYALGGMLVYIAFRFEWVYGTAAVVAVFHDTIITIGLFSLFNKQIDLTVVAALLTLVGYSMNDTIVTFDRIRENLKLMRREKFETLVNISVNQTLSRTVMTSGLTLLTALSLWLFGGQVLNGFSFALVWGIIFGTYSSVFIASPLVIFWQDFRESRKKKKGPGAGGGPAPVATKPLAPSRQPAVSGRKAGRG
jgi:preprotein translocase subunit SecF